MEKLVHGIHHFQATIFRTEQELFERLAKGQNPDALFITCSDSRINPNLLTQTDPGELFILRNAGNIVPPHGASNGGEAATIEFAVAALGIEDIIVCGHSHCGAMTGLLDATKLKDLPATAAWLTHAAAARRIIQEKYPDREGARLLTALVEENVLVQLENLSTHPVVAAGLSSGKLRLHGWVYKIETGQVFAYDAGQNEFVSVTQAGHGQAAPATALQRLPPI